MPPDTIPLVPNNDDVICDRFLHHPAATEKSMSDYPDASEVLGVGKISKIQIQVVSFVHPSAIKGISAEWAKNAFILSSPHMPRHWLNLSHPIPASTLTVSFLAFGPMSILNLPMRQKNLGVEVAPVEVSIWLVVSTHLKHISPNGNLPQLEVKIKHIWNHHLENLANWHSNGKSPFSIGNTPWKGPCSIAPKKTSISQPHLQYALLFVAMVT